MIIYKNKWCKIDSKGGYYILKSLSGKYNDSYFLGLPELCNNAGLTIQEVINYKKVVNK